MEDGTGIYYLKKKMIGNLTQNVFATTHTHTDDDTRDLETEMRVE